METIARDLRYAVRNLLNARGFTVIAMLTLALGIGANTAMFTVINGVILRPLPFSDPQRLVALGEYDTRKGPAIPRGTVSYPDFSDVRSRSHNFDAIAAYHDNDFTLTGLKQPLHIQGTTVSASIFRVLGVQPRLGRAFLDQEDMPGHNVVILSDDFWHSEFSGQDDAVGKTITLNGRAFTVVGVMPAGFQFPVRAEVQSLWTTFSRDRETDNPKDQPSTAQRGNHSLNAIGKLKSGVSLATTNVELASISHALAMEYPKSNAYNGIGIRPEIDRLVGQTRDPLMILLGAVGLVLLIACANVANLVLARSSGRAREIAIRSAIGATRGRIVRQLVTESLVLATMGAGLGIVVAVWALTMVLKLYPANLPRAQEIGVDYWALLFTAALAMVTGILCGLVPALKVSKPNLTDAMRDGRTATAGKAHNRFRSGLVIAQTALGVMLLVGAGLLIRSMQRLSHADLGLNPTHLITASFDLAESYKPERQDHFVHDLLGKLKTLPGVVSVGGSLPLPLNNDGWRVSFNLLDHPVSEQNEPSAGFYVVTPGFFETLQIPLIQGRTFDERDHRNALPVMVVSQAFAKKFFPDEDPIGRRVEIGAGEGEARKAYKKRTIIGVVGDIRTSNVREAPSPAYYIPLPQLMWGPPTLAVRTAGDPYSVVGEVRNVVAAMDPDAPLYDVHTMEDYLALDLGLARFQTVLLGLFAGLALLLTAVGLYGVMAYSVTQRTHEIGVRRALGASAADVLSLVLKRGFVVTVAGIAIGVIAAAALGHLIETLLYQVHPRDPLTYLVVCVTLGIVACLASYLPALRAMRVDPMVALRYE